MIVFICRPSSSVNQPEMDCFFVRPSTRRSRFRFDAIRFPAPATVHAGMRAVSAGRGVFVGLCVLRSLSSLQWL